MGLKFFSKLKDKNLNLNLGEAPTELMAVQTGHDTMEVSWTAPNVPPADGYQITSNGSNIIRQVSASPAILTITTPGVYNVRVMSLSEHFPGRMVEINFIMNGKY